MLVEELLENIKDKKLSDEEQQSEQTKVKKLLQRDYSSLPSDAFDYASYLALFLFTRFAAETEQASLTREEQLHVARLNAIKLIILFGNYDTAIAYLKRYEHRYPDEKQLVHNACLFSLPKNGQCNITLWRTIVLQKHVDHPQDLILRLFPFSKMIEDYVKNHEEELTAEAAHRIQEEFRNEFSNKYDAMMTGQEEWVRDRLHFYEKKIHKEIKSRLNDYLRRNLQLPANGIIGQEDRQRFNERKKIFSDEDRKTQAITKEEVISQYKKKLEQDFLNDNLIFKNQTKQQYIDNQLKEVQGIIHTRIKDKIANLLSPLTPLSEIQHYASQLHYRDADKNPHAAFLFLKYGLPEESFNLYLSLQPQDDSSFIPNILIDGSEISSTYASYYLKKLSSFDPRVAILGKLTSCCQSLGSEGEEPSIYGITHPRAGFYVLCKKNSTHDDDIVAQCLAWRSQDGSLVFDSVESQIDFRTHHELLIIDFYTYLANELIKKHGIPCVLTGVGGATPLGLGIFKPIKVSYPDAYSGYRDSSKQRLVAAQSLPLLHLYKITWPNSVLISDEIVTTKEAVDQWCDLCVFNKKEDAIKHIEPFALKIGLSKECIDQRIALTKEWIKYLFEPSIQLEKIQYYGDRGINLNIFDSKSALYKAVSKDNVEVVNYLIEKDIDVNASDKGGNTALHKAVLIGNLPLVSYLIQKGANVNAKDNHAFTPLHYAAQESNLPLVSYLIQKGANVNAQSADNSTALHIAAQGGNLPTMRYLIEKGADVNAKNDGDYAALHYAVYFKDLPTMRYLIEKGADVNAKNGEGETALYMALNYNKKSIATCLILHGKAEIHDDVKDLIKKVKNNSWRVLRFLIGQEPDVNKKDRDESTLLQYAAAEYDLDTVNYLIEKGADVHATNRFGQTVLFFAAMKGNLEIVNYLVEQYEIDANTIDLFRDPAIFNTIKKDHCKVMDYLIAHGIESNPEVLAFAEPEKRLRLC